MFMVKVIGTLLVVGFVHPFYWWCAAGVVVAWGAYCGMVAAEAERQRRREAAAELVAAVERQDRWYVQGDPRGTYGEPGRLIGR